MKVALIMIIGLVLYWLMVRGMGYVCATGMAVIIVAMIALI